VPTPTWSSRGRATWLAPRGLTAGDQLEGCPLRRAQADAADAVLLLVQPHEDHKVIAFISLVLLLLILGGGGVSPMKYVWSR
jgi:hypothetical protein